jgi:Holliday junction resolvase
MAKPESVFWQQIKKNIKGVSFTRLESWASLGVPDLLCYNEKGTFFTVELKVTRSNKISLSPHQIAFHVKHPNNTFILTKSLDPCASKLYGGTIKLYKGSRIMELKEKGLKLDACCLGLEACNLYFQKLVA